MSSNWRPTGERIQPEKFSLPPSSSRPACCKPRRGNRKIRLGHPQKYTGQHRAVSGQESVLQLLACYFDDVSQGFMSSMLGSVVGSVLLQHLHMARPRRTTSVCRWHKPPTVANTNRAPNSLKRYVVYWVGPARNRNDSTPT